MRRAPGTLLPSPSTMGSGITLSGSTSPQWAFRMTAIEREMVLWV